MTPSMKYWHELSQGTSLGKFFFNYEPIDRLDDVRKILNVVDEEGVGYGQH